MGLAAFPDSNKPNGWRRLFAGMPRAKPRIDWKIGGRDRSRYGRFGGRTRGCGQFEQVVVLERDCLPESAVSRPGTPQARHVHVMLAGGLRALGELLPGFEFGSPVGRSSAIVVARRPVGTTGLRSVSRA